MNFITAKLILKIFVLRLYVLPQIQYLLYSVQAVLAYNRSSYRVFYEGQCFCIVPEFDESKSSDVKGLINLLGKLNTNKMQIQPSRGVLRKKSSENMHQICRRTPMTKCDLGKSHFSMGVNL